MDPQALYRSPNALAPNYSLFRVAERCLLTGHSHQAWPDRSLNAQRQAWLGFLGDSMRGVPVVEAFEHHFAGSDLAQLEADFLRWVFAQAASSPSASSQRSPGRSWRSRFRAVGWQKARMPPLASRSGVACSRGRWKK